MKMKNIKANSTYIVTIIVSQWY